MDIMMPGTDGLTVCRELRSVSDIPIILLTAKDSELDYVMGISQGGDDYLTKPFRPTILLMKVRALLRRVEMDGRKTAAATADELRYGDLRYSATENAVLCGNAPVALTQTELRLLSYMMRQPGESLLPRGAAQRSLGLRFGGGDPCDGRNPSPHPEKAAAGRQRRQCDYDLGLWV